MADEFEFAKWCEGNGSTKETADTLTEQDLNVSKAFNSVKSIELVEVH